MQPKCTIVNRSNFCVSAFLMRFCSKCDWRCLFLVSIFTICVTLHQYFIVFGTHYFATNYQNVLVIIPIASSSPFCLLDFFYIYCLIYNTAQLSHIPTYFCFLQKHHTLFKVRYFMGFFSLLFFFVCFFSVIVSLTFCVWLTYKHLLNSHARQSANAKCKWFEMQTEFFLTSNIHWALYE